jgi:hypothetical protein
MSTLQQRYWQAYRHACRRGYEVATGSEGWAEALYLYDKTVRSEMEAFEKLEAMRKPVPNQTQIDGAAAAILRGQTPSEAALQNILERTKYAADDIEDANAAIDDVRLWAKDALGGR